MGMIKTILPGSYSFDESITKQIMIGNRGLRGFDKQAFIKRASGWSLDIMQKLATGPGDVIVHMIALGTTESIGPNRNGDGFAESACKRYHDTFVKHARFYRNHLNKDSKKSYGIVKASMFNEPMGRIELIVALNGTEEAARRNGGLVADKELEKLASGDDIAVSMSCKVAYDVCSICGNKAATRKDYCTEDNCDGGGCTHNLCKIAEDGKITFVDNPHPTWFDISNVFRPADRIAYVFGELEKAASANKVIGGAEISQRLGISAPFDLTLSTITNKTIVDQIKLAQELADIETKLQLNLTKEAYHQTPATNPRVDGLDQLSLNKYDTANVLKAMAREKISMSLSDFIQFTTGCNRNKADTLSNEVKPYLPNVFNSMCADVEKLAEDLRTNPFVPSNTEPSLKWVKWAREKAASGSVDYYWVRQRTYLDSINNRPQLTIKSAAAKYGSEAHENVARLFGLYKIALLHEIKQTDPSFALTASLVVRQNYI